MFYATCQHLFKYFKLSFWSNEEIGVPGENHQATESYIVMTTLWLKKLYQVHIAPDGVSGPTTIAMIGTDCIIVRCNSMTKTNIQSPRTNNICTIFLSLISPIIIYTSEWLLFNAKWAIFQIYPYKLVFIVLAHWKTVCWYSTCYSIWTYFLYSMPTGLVFTS